MDIELLRRLDGAVIQAFGFVASEEQLFCCEEGFDVLVLLILEKLADALASTNAGTFQLEHSESYAVYVYHQVWTLAGFTVRPENGDLFRDIEVVVIRIVPVDIPKRGTRIVFALHVNAITQQVINILVHLIERIDLIARCAGQLGYGVAYLLFGVTALFKVFP